MKRCGDIISVESSVVVVKVGVRVVAGGAAEVVGVAATNVV